MVYGSKKTQVRKISDMTDSSRKQKSQSYIIPTIILGLVILGSLFYFGSFWYKALSPSAPSGETQETAQENEVLSQKTQVVEPPTESKSEKPNVELFVMSHCPYGTQIEKAMIPVVQTLKDKIDFDLKFVYYAMHGKEEMDEQLTQYCIQKESPEKLIPYLECFLESSDSPSCIAEAQIAQSSLDSCTTQADQEFDVTASFEDKSSWLSGRFPLFNVHVEENDQYQVKGSPTLIINGQSAQVQSRDPNTLLATVCSYFQEKPEECNSTLSTDVPAPGFGSGVASNSTSAQCN